MQIKIDLSKKYAIALEGGGAKGAYEIGVWRALQEAGIQFCACLLYTSCSCLRHWKQEAPRIHCWQYSRHPKHAHRLRLCPQMHICMQSLLYTAAGCESGEWPSNSLLAVCRKGAYMKDTIICLLYTSRCV